jgi:hypothetical protein
LQIDGRVFCWGDNSPDFGTPTLDVGATDADVPAPRQVSGLLPPSALAAGYETTCATVGGRLECWGVIGLASMEVSGTPVDVGGAATSLAVAEQAACAIANGGLRCWGNKVTSGVYPTFTTASAPLSVAMGGSSVCTTTTDGHVWCAGEWSPTPVTVY